MLLCGKGVGGLPLFGADMLILHVLARGTSSSDATKGQSSMKLFRPLLVRL